MKRHEYKNQNQTARAIARSISQTEQQRRETAALILRVVQHFSGHITGLNASRPSKEASR